VRFWDAAPLTSFRFSRSSTFRDRQETGQFSYRRVPRWLIRFLGGDDTKKQGGNLARDTLLCKGVLSPLNHFLRDLLA
jgi:hypothetical protein